MADLLDIAPSTAVEIVKLDGLRIKVHGVSVDAIASIVSRFPALKSLAGGGDGDIVPKLIAGFGAAIGPIIAAGCGHLNEEAYEQRAATLLPEQQLKLLRAIVGLTFPNGFGPVMEAATAIMNGGALDVPEKPVKVRLKKSASPLPPSSDVDFHPDHAMTLTPRQLAAWLEFSDKIDRIDRANALVISAVGAQGDKQALDKMLKELTSG